MGTDRNLFVFGFFKPYSQLSYIHSFYWRVSHLGVAWLMLLQFPYFVVVGAAFPYNE